MRVQLTRPVTAPNRGTDQSAGIDFYVPNDFLEQMNMHEGVKHFNLHPGETCKIPSGVIVKLPPNMCLIFLNKSSVGICGVHVGPQLIDPDYQGEIHLCLTNVGDSLFQIKPGMKLCQALIMPITRINPIVVEDAWGNEKTERGIGGFGSTDDRHDPVSSKLWPMDKNILVEEDERRKQFHGRNDGTSEVLLKNRYETHYNGEPNNIDY